MSFVCISSYWRAAALVVGMAASPLAIARGVYQEPDAFIREIFAARPAMAQTLWLTDTLQADIERILGHKYPALRLRYWVDGRRSAWILEEIGKEQPITVGVLVQQDKIELMRVLIFRESRGGEVRHPFFTDQFKGLGLSQSDQLDRGVDGISGATLSVRALTKLARLALHLHRVALK